METEAPLWGVLQPELRLSGRQGLAPHCVFSVNLPTKAMTQVQQTIQRTTRHVTPAKLLGQDFLGFPPLSKCPLVEYPRSPCVDVNQDTKHGSVVFPRGLFLCNLRRQQVGLHNGWLPRMAVFVLASMLVFTSLLFLSCCVHHQCFSVFLTPRPAVNFQPVCRHDVRLKLCGAV